MASSVNQIARDLLELSKQLENARTTSRVNIAAAAPAGQSEYCKELSNQQLSRNGSGSANAGGGARTVTAGGGGAQSSASARTPNNASAVTSGSLAGAASRLSANNNGVVGSLAAAASAFSINSTGTGNYLSQIEQAVLRSTNPIESSETEEVDIDGVAGLWLNRNETINWKGDVPLENYPINQDANPEIITKRSEQKLEYVQELAIRYLRPPTPPAPGEIIINQEPNTLAQPAPPLVIRQQPPRPETPEPLVIREAPPQPPAQVGRKVITISGRNLPPPPRKVVIERLAPLPSKPQSVIIERWLPYNQVKRRVILNRATQGDAVTLTPRNVIVQWEAPQVDVRKEYKYLGVVRANPVEYVQRYGQSLVVSSDLPEFVQSIDTPDGLVLAADYEFNGIHELEGDVEMLKYVDLEREGLGEYREFLNRFSRASATNSLNNSAVVVGSSSSSGASAASGPALTAQSATATAKAPSQTNLLADNQLQRTATQRSQATNTNNSTAAQDQEPQAPSASGAAGVFASVSVSTAASAAALSAAALSAAASSAAVSSAAALSAAANKAAAASVSAATAATASQQLNDLVEVLFKQIDTKNSGKISVEAAEKLLLKLNSRLGRNYGEDDVRALFNALDCNQDGVLSLEEFRLAFLNLAI